MFCICALKKFDPVTEVRHLVCVIRQNILVHGVWGPALPQFVFGAAGIITAVITLVLPETKGQSLPETVKEAAALR